MNTPTITPTKTPGVSKRVTARGVTRFDVYWRTAEGRARKRTFERYADAVGFKHATERDVKRGQHVDTSRAASVPTVFEAVRAWSALREARGKQRDTTRERVESFARCHIDGTELGGLRVVDVTEDDVLLWLASRRRAGLAGSTVRTGFKYLRSAFRWAVDKRYIVSSPVTGDVSAAQPDDDTDEAVALTRSEVDALTEAIPAHLRLYVTLGCGTGMRPGEMRGVRVSDVLRSTKGGGVIHLTEQSRQDGTRAALKTKRSRRDVILSAGVLRAVEAHCETFELTGDDLLFRPFGSAKAYSSNGLGDVFKRAAKRAGLPESITPHNLRHTFVSWAVDAHLTEVEIGARIGDHPETVSRVYAHMLRDRDDRLRDVIDLALFGVEQQPNISLRLAQ